MYIATSALRSSSSRSEEHTSELQSQFHLVCRLLLEQKNGLDFAESAADHDDLRGHGVVRHSSARRNRDDRERRDWDRGAQHDLFSRAFFFFNDTATTEIYTLSLHDALPI